MQLWVHRDVHGDTFTAGRLYVDGAFFCFSLEDADREIPGVPVSEWKVPGETAIPRGSYDVRLTMSARFKRVMPEVCDVPGFTGIRIHTGNTSRDTEGCLLVGLQTDNAGSVYQSKDAFNRLFAKLQAAQDRSEPVRITYSNEPPPSPAGQPTDTEAWGG